MAPAHEALAWLGVEAQEIELTVAAVPATVDDAVDGLTADAAPLPEVRHRLRTRLIGHMSHHNRSVGSFPEPELPRRPPARGGRRRNAHAGRFPRLDAGPNAPAPPLPAAVLVLPRLASGSLRAVGAAVRAARAPSIGWL